MLEEEKQTSNSDLDALRERAQNLFSIAAVWMGLLVFIFISVLVSMSRMGGEMGDGLLFLFLLVLAIYFSIPLIWSWRLSRTSSENIKSLKIQFFLAAVMLILPFFLIIMTLLFIFLN